MSPCGRRVGGVRVQDWVRGSKEEEEGSVRRKAVWSGAGRVQLVGAWDWQRALQSLGLHVF